MTKYDPDLSRIFHALSDPTRRAMMIQLAAGPAAISDLALPSGFALPTIQRHIAVLQQAGLITTEKLGRSRMCRAAPHALQHPRDWMEQVRAQMIAQTDRLEAYATTLLKDTK